MISEKYNLLVQYVGHLFKITNITEFLTDKQYFRYLEKSEYFVFYIRNLESERMYARSVCKLKL